MRKITATLKVSNPLGMHTRPAFVLARVAKEYNADIMVRNGQSFVNVKSALNLLSLSAIKGTQLIIEAEGIDADEAIRNIVELFDSPFNEL